MSKLNVIFMGTPDFSVPALELLYNHPMIHISYVISMPDRPAGRGQQLKSPEVIEYAKKHKITFFQTENINKEIDFLTKIKNEKIDLCIVLAFAQFLGKNILELPKLGCFNIHTSLLPKYRGAAPIQYALLNGDTSTGVSIQKMVKKMDAGDIAKFQEIAIHPTETGGQLYTRLKFQAALTLNEFIYDLIEDKIKYQIQDENQVSFAPTLNKEDGFLDFKNSNFQKISNQLRALDPWPGTWCYLNNKRLKVLSLESSHTKLQSGEVSSKTGELLVGCSDKTIRLTEVQLEGKNKCKDFELLNGFKGPIKINPGN
jgi:methionyl-tRNA formyltransferase